MNAIPKPDSDSGITPAAPFKAAKPLMNSAHVAPGPLPQDPAHDQRLQALGTLSAALAHEMNNLLTPILGYARLAMQRPDDLALQQKAASKTHDAAERAVHACTAVMSLARGPVPVGTSQTAVVADAVHAAAALLGWAEPGADTQVHVTVEPADLAAAMSPTALEQVLVNLMQNARRAMGPGGAVSISAHKNRSTQQLEMTLSDSGPGVPDQHAPMLFEPFVTGPAASRTDGEKPGTGLGLWISRALVESAGGSLELAANPSDQPGACFRLALREFQGTPERDRRAA